MIFLEKFMIKDLRRKKGFTLIELLISISIIAILSVVLSISFSNAQKNGRDQRRIADLKAIQNAAEQYYLLSGGYPSLINYTAGRRWAVGTQSVLERYPSDPKNTGTYIYSASSILSTSYCVCAMVENTTKNSNSGSECDFANPSSYFCVKNQQ